MKNQALLTLAAALPLALASCATAPQPNDQLLEEAGSTYREYGECVISAADAYVHSRSTAYEIADAAHANCIREFRAYGDAVESMFRNAVSATTSGHLTAQTAAHRRIRESKQRIRDIAVRHVVLQRTPNQSAPEPLGDVRL